MSQNQPQPVFQNVTKGGTFQKTIMSRQSKFLLQEVAGDWAGLDLIDQIEIVCIVAWGLYKKLNTRQKTLLIAAALFLACGGTLLVIDAIVTPGTAGDMVRLGWAFLAGALFMLCVILLADRRH